MKPYWQNPEIQQLNRLPSRSPLYPFSDEQAALSDAAQGPELREKPQTDWYQSLDGSWDFYLLGTPEEPLPAPDAWKPIQVPGTWTLQGYDKPHYTNVQMPWSPVPPYVPEQNPTGLYKKTLSVPAAWKGRRVVLHVGSAESCLLVYVNGELCGVSKDTRLPAEFDITDSISWSADSGTGCGAACTGAGSTQGSVGGSAELLLKVVRYSDASFVEDQDQWWFGGLHRSIYLYSTAQTYVQDVQALTSVAIAADGAKTGAVAVTVPLGYRAEKGTIPLKPELDCLERTVVASLYEMTGDVAQPAVGKKLAEAKQTLCYDYRMNEAKARLVLETPAPKLWSSETPALYLVAVSLYESDGGSLIESTACTIGFKSVTVANRELRINGKKVYIHGVNRHEHNDSIGKTLTTAEMKRDILLLKQHNFNAVRTCHYPDDERWYELCDRYGIYILDEANIENHAYYDLMCRSDEWTGAYMQRVQRMYRRDKNHACIFGWSLGNESGAAENHDAMAAWLHKIDSTRIVHYEGYSRPEFRQSAYTVESLGRGKGVVDIISPMYPQISLITEFAQKADDDRPLIMCEYSHAMGNSNGSLGDYWRAIEANHGLQGGFIWDWIDQGLAAVDKNGAKYWKYGGDFGDEPTDYDFCLNGLLLPDQTPKPAMEECRVLFAPVRLHEVSAAQGRFVVENRFDFTRLDVLTMRWTLLCDGSECASGSSLLPAILPDEKAPVTIPLAEALAKLSAREQAGELVLAVTFEYAADMPFACAGTLCSRKSVLVRPRAATPALHGNTCKPQQEAVSPLTQLVAAARPQLFRALTENECIKARLNTIGTPSESHYFHCGATLDWLHADLLHLQEKDGALFTGSGATSEFAQKKLGSFCKHVTPFAAPDGTPGVCLEVQFELTDVVSEYPRVGITLPVSAAFSQTSWYGYGPQECYSDRLDGAALGSYSLPTAHMGTDYIVPQENGNRCGVRHLTLRARDGRTLHIAGDAPFNFSILRFTTEDLWQARHTCELTDTTLGAMAGIAGTAGKCGCDTASATASATALASDATGGFYTLNLDSAMRGIGTASCGDDTLPQDRVYPGTYRMKLYLW